MQKIAVYDISRYKRLIGVVNVPEGTNALDLANELDEQALLKNFALVVQN